MNVMKILLNFNTKVGKDDISKPTIGNVSLHEINNDNAVILVNFTTLENLNSQKHDVHTSQHQ
jgi:hypothetical protein